MAAPQLELLVWNMFENRKRLFFFLPEEFSKCSPLTPNVLFVLGTTWFIGFGLWSTKGSF